MSSPAKRATARPGSFPVLPIVIGGTLTTKGLKLDDGLKIEEVLALAKQLVCMERALPWWWGDLLIYADPKLGDRLREWTEASHLSYQTLHNYKTVAKAIAFSRRREKLSFTHHEAVAALPVAVADRLLLKAEASNMSVKDLRSYVCGTRTRPPYKSPAPLLDAKGRLIRNKIIRGDALKILKAIPDGRFDMSVTSPPYFAQRDYGVAGQIGWEATPKEYIERLVLVFAEVHRVLKPDGLLWVVIGDSYAGSGKGPTGFNGIGNQAERQGFDKLKGDKLYGLKPKDLIGIPWMLAFALRDECGFHLRCDAVWHKPNPMPESVTDRPTIDHEYAFMFCKSENYFYDGDSTKQPVKQDWGTRDRTKGKYHNEGTGLNPHRGLTKSYETRNMRSVMTVPCVPYKGGHYATYPPDLIRPFIRAGSQKGGLVIDPFFGAGTTGLVAKQEGRDYIGIELNPDYAEQAETRIKSWRPS